MKPTLFNAYQQALYIVMDHDEKLVIKVGLHDQRLDDLLTKYQAKMAIFITAYNPHSQLFSADSNQLNHLKLKQRLDQQAFQYLPGYSTNEKGDWPKEESLLVFNMLTDDADELARLFNQNAYLMIKLNQTAQLTVVKKS